MEHNLKDVLKQFLKTYGLEEKLVGVQLRASWEKLMGKTIASHTVDIHIKQRKLYVSFDSAALRTELSYAKEKVKKMLNEELGEELIDEVILR